jgi:uncharacterized SAM-binding protein YcdF (DUF218 family)
MSFNWPPLYEPYSEPAAPPAEAPSSAPRRNRRRRLVAVASLALLFVAGIVVFLRVGQWLVVEDPLAPADAIVVLSGRIPERAMEAARIYHRGVASEVWISQPTSPADELAKLNIHYLGEDFYNQQILLAMNVPPDAIRVLDQPAVNTEAEVDGIAADLRADGFTSVIIVTSKPHTRRVRAIWKRRAGPGLRLIVRYPEDDPYDGAHWWRTTRDALDVVREVLGLLNAWAGFPLHAL